MSSVLLTVHKAAAFCGPAWSAMVLSSMRPYNADSSFRPGSEPHHDL